MAEETLVFDSAAAMNFRQITTTHVVVVAVALALACYVGYRIGAVNVEPK